MKKCLIFLFFTILFQPSLCKTTVFQFAYNYPYIIYESKSADDYLAPDTFYGKIEVHLNDEIDLQLRVLKNAIISFEISVVLFDHEPSDNEVIDYTGWQSYQAVVDTFSSNDYDIYKYPAKISTSNYNYMAIRFTTKYSLHFLSFFALSSKYNYIKDLDINQDYLADLSIFPNQQFPPEFHYYFRTKVNSKEEIKFELKTQKRSQNLNFKLDVCQYSNYPNSANVYGDYVPSGVECNTNTNLIKYDDDSSYDTYISKMNTNKDISYLAIHLGCMIPNENYLGISIKSEKSDNNMAPILKVNISLLIALIILSLGLF